MSQIRDTPAMFHGVFVPLIMATIQYNVDTYILLEVADSLHSSLYECSLYIKASLLALDRLSANQDAVRKLLELLSWSLETTPLSYCFKRPDR